MQRQINKKIYIFFLIFLTLGTLNNKNISQLNFSDKKNFKIINKSEFNEDVIIRELYNLQNENLFLLKKKKILDIINSYPFVENSFIFKNYPSNLYINIKRTKFLAITKKNGKNYYIGSNGNFIKVEEKTKKLPFIFGNVEISDFLNLITVIKNSDFDYNDIRNFYYFKNKRWDIETNNGLIIKLPSKNLEIAFGTLFKILQNKNFKNTTKIDLRQIKQIVIDE